MYRVFAEVRKYCADIFDMWVAEIQDAGSRCMWLEGYADMGPDVGFSLAFWKRSDRSSLLSNIDRSLQDFIGTYECICHIYKVR